MLISGGGLPVAALMRRELKILLQTLAKACQQIQHAPFPLYKSATAACLLAQVAIVLVADYGAAARCTTGSL